jgi:hypothetical protein
VDAMWDHVMGPPADELASGRAPWGHPRIYIRGAGMHEMSSESRGLEYRLLVIAWSEF